MSNCLQVHVSIVSTHLTELNMDVSVSRVVTQSTILPGTMSLGTRNETHATDTKMMLGMYVWMMW